MKKILNELYYYFYIRGHRFFYGVRQRKTSYDLPYFISKNKKSKEKYVVFRYASPTYAILAAARNYVFAYLWAYKHGMIPLMDIEQEYEYENHRLGVNNLWDEIFEQPITVKEVQEKDWVLVESLNSRRLSFRPYDILINGKKDDCFLRIRTGDGWREYYKKVQSYAENCFKLRPEMQETCEKLCYEKIGDGKNVLGISLREVFSMDADKYFTNKETRNVYDKHPKTYGVLTIIEMAKEYMEKWQCNKIFISTVFSDSVEQFEKTFGEKVVWIDRDRKRLDERLVSSNVAWTKNNREIWESVHTQEGQKENMEMTTSYIKEMYILSKCDCFLASRCSGTTMALALNGGEYRQFECLPDINKSELY